jgi:hypothetical protein
VYIDEVLKTEPLGEARRSSEGLCREPGQVLDVMRLSFAEQRLQDRIGQHLGVEDLLQAVQPLITAAMLVESGHPTAS